MGRYQLSRKDSKINGRFHAIQAREEEARKVEKAKAAKKAKEAAKAVHPGHDHPTSM